MIVRLSGKLVEKKDQAVVIQQGGLAYEVMVPTSVLARIEDTLDDQGNVHLIIYYYLQINQSSGFPVLIGFINEVERDFFLHFIKVSGIGPRAAVKALGQPIGEITQAIDRGDVAYLKTLPGIGMQRAKEVVAKLQGKIGKFGLIQDQNTATVVKHEKEDWQEEALSVLLQLQYKKDEASAMINKAIDQKKSISSAEELLSEIYKQRSHT
ncbi:MAG: Holliday junction DNA helicase RuvA [Lysobacterales bacterium]|jgi:Holliday junction DNA helicase RuvA